MADPKTATKQAPAQGETKEKKEAKAPKTEAEMRRSFGTAANKTISTLRRQGRRIEKLMGGRGYAYSPAQRAALRDAVAKSYERALATIDGETRSEAPAVPVE